MNGWIDSIYLMVMNVDALWLARSGLRIEQRLFRGGVNLLENKIIWTESNESERRISMLTEYRAAKAARRVII